MVDAALRALASQRPLAGISERTQLRWGSAAADVIAVLGAYLGALALRNSALPAFGAPSIPLAPDWAVAIVVLAATSVFYVSGLYELEAYVSRPLHLWMLLKSSLVAFAVSTFAVYALKSRAFDGPRLVLLMTFVGFFLLACVLRLALLDSLYVAWMRRSEPISFVLGDSPSAEMLADRLRQMRGLGCVEQVAPSASGLDVADALAAKIERLLSIDERTVSVFIDGANVDPQQVFRVADVALALGADVYVMSGLLQPLECNRLLSTLFEAPVVRVRGRIHRNKAYPLKRAFDVIGSAILLLAFAPVLAVLGVVIRLTSPGPAFFKQTRVGRSAIPFEFVKLRSMVPNSDESIHSDYVLAFMRGAADSVQQPEGGEAVYKRIDDPRITSIGRVIRKYSLDELPQFWNVLRGDMSLVGPRPPLPYEVCEYDQWCALRLAIPSGITGLWQVAGRSRVSFDEMILQDLMYAQNMRLLLDVKLCLGTIPALLLGYGGG